MLLFTILPLKPAVKHTSKWTFRSLGELPKCALGWAGLRQIMTGLVRLPVACPFLLPGAGGGRGGGMPAGGARPGRLLRHLLPLPYKPGHTDGGGGGARQCQVGMLIELFPPPAPHLHPAPTPPGRPPHPPRPPRQCCPQPPTLLGFGSHQLPLPHAAQESPSILH